MTKLNEEILDIAVEVMADLVQNHGYTEEDAAEKVASDGSLVAKRIEEIYRAEKKNKCGSAAYMNKK